MFSPVIIQVCDWVPLFPPFGFVNLLGLRPQPLPPDNHVIHRHGPAGVMILVPLCCLRKKLTRTTYCFGSLSFDEEDTQILLFRDGSGLFCSSSPVGAAGSAAGLCTQTVGVHRGIRSVRLVNTELWCSSFVVQLPKGCL